MYYWAVGATVGLFCVSLISRLAHEMLYSTLYLIGTAICFAILGAGKK